MAQDQMFKSSRGRPQLWWLILFFIVFILAAFVATAGIMYRFNQNLEEHIQETATPPESQCEEAVDIAIIGAGASGAYAAWKLSEAYPGKSIHVYDLNDRIGGRIYSVPIPGIGDFVADLGAMRFRPKYHPLTWKVIQDLELEVTNFTTPNPGEILYYVRGRHLLQEHLDRGEVPYILTTEERNHSRGYSTLTRFLNNKFIVPGQEDPYERVTREGELAYKLGNINQWLKYSSPEFLRFMTDIAGWESWTYANQNLAHVSDTGEGSTARPLPFLTLKNGMDTIPKAMLDKLLAKNTRNRLNLRHELIAVDSSSTNISIILNDKNTKKVRHVCTEKLILTIHPEALKHLTWVKSPDSSDITFHSEAISKTVAVKVYLAYDSPWWRDGGYGQVFEQIHSSGEVLKRVITDLPVRQVLDIGEDSRTGKSLLLIYNDWHNLNFWKNSLETSDKDSTAIKGEFTPSVHLLDLIHNQLAEIFNKSLRNPKAICISGSSMVQGTISCCLALLVAW